MGQFLTSDEQYAILANEVGWFDMSPLEKLAAIIIDELRDEIAGFEDKLAEETSEIQSRLDESEEELSSSQYRTEDLEQQVRDLEEQVYDLEHSDHDENDSDGVSELEREVEFLNTLVTDMEAELALIDSERAAA